MIRTYVVGNPSVHAHIHVQGPTKIYFAQGVPCEPEALSVEALGGLFYFMSICVDIPIKIGVGAFSNQQ